MTIKYLIQLSLLVFISNSWAGALCPHVEGNRPALSFSLLSFRPGELDRDCETKVARARSLGFTSVTFIPTFAYDRSAQQIASQPSVLPGEIERCLNAIARVGMDVVYQPHLDALETIQGEGEAGWRALFEVHPDRRYRDIVFGDYLRWLASHSAEIRAEGSAHHSIVISAELERSLQIFSGQWVKFLGGLRSALAVAALGDLVPVGINPNWNPLGGLDPRQNCNAYQQLINDIDFVAPSMYGDWSQTGYGVRQVELRVDAVRLTLQNQFARSCAISAFATRPFSIGEFGIGRNLLSAEMRLPAVMTENFVQQRRLIYENILNWARSQSSRFYQQPLSIWTLGVFDPVGIEVGQNEVLADYEIAQMFRQYTAQRCPGLVLPPLATDSFLQQNTIPHSVGEASQPFLVRLRIFLKPYLDRFH